MIHNHLSRTQEILGTHYALDRAVEVLGCPAFHKTASERIGVGYLIDIPDHPRPPMRHFYYLLFNQEGFYFCWFSHYFWSEILGGWDRRGTHKYTDLEKLLVTVKNSYSVGEARYLRKEIPGLHQFAEALQEVPPLLSHRMPHDSE